MASPHVINADPELGRLGLALADFGAAMHPVVSSAAGVLGLRPPRRLDDSRQVFVALRSARPPDVLLIHWAPPDERPIKLCRAIRSRGSSPLPFLPLMIVCEKVTKAHVLAARDAGVDEFLAAPFTARALRERLLAIVEQRRGFVDVPGYFGPDRRRGAMADWLGCNRRTGNDALIDPATGRIYVD